MTGNTRYSKLYHAIFILMTCALMAGLAADPATIMIEDFQGYSSSPFSKWKTRGDAITKAEKVYRIRAEGANAYLQASTTGNPSISIQIAREVSWNISSHPVLSWKWRARRLPAGGNERIGKTNDSAAGIYVLFKRKHVPLASWAYQPVDIIKYVWSTRVPRYEVIRKSPRQKMGVTYYRGVFVVLQSGGNNLGKWMTEERNVREDYRRFYGSYPRYHPLAIAVLTDSNDTGSSAEADYDDFSVKQQ